MDAIACWMCMKREVTTVGEICQHCIDKYPKRKSVDDMTLEELVKTQRKGTVPGDSYRAKMEFPNGVPRHTVYDDNNLCP